MTEQKPARGREVFIIIVAVLLIAGLGFGVAAYLPSSIELNNDFDAIQFIEHLAILTIIATAIERATQSALFLTQADGTDRAIVAATGTKAKDGSRAAMIISLPLGLAVGLTGIGVITPLVEVQPSGLASAEDIVRETISILQSTAGGLSPSITAENIGQAVVSASVDAGTEDSVELTRSILRGVDTIVTGGLLAGGASGIHQVSEAAKALVRGPDRARADALTGAPKGTANPPVLSLELATDAKKLWHLDRSFNIEGADDGIQVGTYHRVALRGDTVEQMFIEFPLTTDTGRIPKITTTDLAAGGLSMIREDLTALADRLGAMARTDLKIVVRRV